MEDWKDALDKNIFVGATLMDLSRAFDCLPHDLIIENLKRMGYLTVPAGLWQAMFQIE